MSSGQSSNLDPRLTHSRAEFVEYYHGTKEWDKALRGGYSCTEDIVIARLNGTDLDDVIAPPEVVVSRYSTNHLEDEPSSAVPERRIDPTDGQPYTRGHFLDFYKRLAEWKAARIYEPLGARFSQDKDDATGSPTVSTLIAAHHLFLNGLIAPRPPLKPAQALGPDGEPVRPGNQFEPRPARDSD